MDFLTDFFIRGAVAKAFNIIISAEKRRSLKIFASKSLMWQCFQKIIKK
jgi:hypothetical protein